ncbi:hypothetical protein GUJ93_ZPchr0046g33485 [Zizania palustris]|uniref:Uncharacterized protein n=1 Tax=Zizania palustris TaxID=103762 RepID=A0A8J5RMW8_ZIZPA|nr:hypothetical protein GUJ93_ZPchr0046g33485 [Zizania palustris]
MRSCRIAHCTDITEKQFFRKAERREGTCSWTMHSCTLHRQRMEDAVDLLLEDVVAGPKPRRHDELTKRRAEEIHAAAHGRQRIGGRRCGGGRRRDVRRREMWAGVWGLGRWVG